MCAKALQFGGEQLIRGKDFTIPLNWDGKTVFFCHTKVKLSDKTLLTRKITSDLPYKPRDYAYKIALDHAMQSPDLNQVEPELQDLHEDDAKAQNLRTTDFRLAPTLEAIQEPEFQANIRLRRRFLWDVTKHNWLPHQLAEWKRRLAVTSDDTVKKTFAATTQLVPSLRHENEQFPKDAHISRFPHFPARRLREIMYCDVVEYPLTGKRGKQYALLFYGEKSKITATYHLGKTQASAQVLAHMYEFVRDYGCPDTFKSDYANNLSQSDKWRRFTRVTFTKIESSEAGKKSSNRVERAWQDLQRKAIIFAKSYKVPEKQFPALYKHLCDCHNHTSLASLGWKTPMEAMTGDTPDISIFRFHFWEPVWFKAVTNVTTKQIVWVKGRFRGIAWATGDTMCYNVVAEDNYPRSIHRTTVLPRHVEEEMPRQILTNPSDYFFPTPCAPDNISPQPVGRKRNIEQSEEHEKEEVPNSELEEDPTITEGPPKVAGPKEAQFRKEYLESTREYDKTLNELSVPLADLMDTESISKILSHNYYKVKGEALKELRFRVEMTEGNILNKVTYDDLKIDAPVALSTYILKSKSLQKDPKLIKYAKSMARTHEKILRLTSEREIGLGTKQAVINEAGQVSSRRRTLGQKPQRTKKASRNKRKSNPMGKYHYGVYVPLTVADAKRVDKENGNTLWADAIIKEVQSLWSMKTFKILSKAEKVRLKENYQIAPLRCIFDVKQDGRRKARIIIGGHVIDTTGYDKYASNMKTISARVLMLIASANKFDVLTGDISTAYLYATGNLKVATKLGEEFSLYDSRIKAGTYASVVQALYGLPNSANRWHAHLADTLRCMDFKPSRFDPDVWYHLKDGQYEYIGTHTDDLMIVGRNPRALMDTLSKTYTINKIGEPSFHLGCDYTKNGDGTWSVGTKTYVQEALKKVKIILGKEDDSLGNDTLGFEGVPIKEKFKPEIDMSDFCDEDLHRNYQQLVGIAQWLITCGRLDLSFAISSLSRFSHAPRKGHLHAAVQVFKYLNKHPEKWIRLDPSPHVPPGPLTEPSDLKDVDWKQHYSEAHEEIDPKFPPERGVALTTAIYFDSNWAHDELTRKSISGVVTFIGSTPVTWLSRRQGAIATSTYSAELTACKVACEEAISIRYMLRSLGVPVKGPTNLIGDNLGSLMSATNPGSECKKRHVNIAFHYARECNAAGIVSFKKIHTDFNYSDAWTKALDGNKFWTHFKLLFGKGLDSKVSVD